MLGFNCKKVLLCKYYKGSGLKSGPKHDITAKTFHRRVYWLLENKAYFLIHYFDKVNEICIEP